MVSANKIYGRENEIISNFFAAKNRIIRMKQAVARNESNTLFAQPMSAHTPKTIHITLFLRTNMIIKNVFESMRVFRKLSSYSIESHGWSYSLLTNALCAYT